MERPAGLNRRHKVALFLTLLAAGASLVLNMSAKQTAGVVLLGLAFAWAFGSNSRAVHVLFIALGVLLITFGMAVLRPLSDYYQKKVDFESFDAEQNAYATLSDENGCAAPPRGLLITRQELQSELDSLGGPWQEYRDRPQSLACGIPDTEWGELVYPVHVDDFLTKYPAWKSAIIEQHKPPLRPIIKEWISGSLPFSVPGLLLVCIGLGLIFGISRAKHTRSEEGGESRTGET
jgi:uncharacterized membrane protein